MNQQRIDEIRARAEAATRGPWHRRGGRGQLIDAALENEDMRTVIADVWGAQNGMFNTADMVERDADFIAHARADIPDLLDEVDKLHRELDAAKLDMRRTMSPSCQSCVHGNARSEQTCARCSCDYDNWHTDEFNWEWRGPCAENGGANA